MKCCYVCGEQKSLNDYYKHPQMLDGHLNKCKECHKAAMITNRRKRLEYYQEYDRKRGNLPHRVKARQEYADTLPQEYKNELSWKWIRRNPQKRIAHIIAGNAIRNGTLVKQPCEACGEKVVEAHHDDYSKPLTVRWLCRICHTRHHKEEREIERAKNKVSF